MNQEQVILRLHQSLSSVENAISQLQNHPGPMFSEDLRILISRRQEIERKVLELTIPPLPATPLSSPAVTPEPGDNFPAYQLLAGTFAAVACIGLVAWGAKDIKNMATVLDIVHLANASLNPGRAPPYNKP